MMSKSTVMKKRLINASYTGDLNMIEELIDEGMDVNAVDENGKTALMWTSQGGFYEAVNYLVLKGANVNLRNGFGRTILTIAAWSGNLDVLELLINEGTDLNVQCATKGMTTLMEATWMGNLDVIKFLLSKGADINITDNTGRTVVDWALDWGQKAIFAHIKSLKGPLSLTHITLNLIEKEGIERNSLPKILFMR